MSEIKELKEVLEFGLALGMSVDEALEDGWNWTDLLALVPPMTKLPAALEGLEFVDDEIAGLDQNGKNELVEVIEKLELDSELTEEIVEQSLVTAIEIGKLITVLRKAKKQG
jgi:hypothetical protein